MLFRSARIVELEGMFAAAGEADPDDDDLESGVLPKALVKALKDEKKGYNGQLKELRKELKELKADLKRMQEADNIQPAEIAAQETSISQTDQRIKDKNNSKDDVDERLKGHAELERGLKDLKAGIRKVENKMDELVAQAREKITEEEAKKLILQRFHKELLATYDDYLRQYLRGFIAAVDTLWDKYAVTLNDILSDRDREAEQLNEFLVELG